MVLVFFIVVIILYVVFRFFSDKEKMLSVQVDQYGGISEKYKQLVECFKRDFGTKVIKVTRESIHLRSLGSTTSVDFIIIENFNRTEIEWQARLGLVGNYKNSWTFNSSTSQSQMYKEIVDKMTIINKSIFGDF